MTAIDFETITLKSGGHETPDDGMSVMEAVALYDGQDFNDAPPCVSRVIRSFCISWNDALPDDETRTRLLRPFIPKVIGTNTGEADEQVRAWMACDWLVRTYTPTWLRKIGLDDDAAALEQLDALTSTDLANTALPTIRKARERSAAAWAAAWNAAWTAAGDAAGTAARTAAGTAAWDAAGAAAWDAARTAAWTAAWNAARTAAGTAAWDAAGAALRETTVELQASACDLLERMCAVGRAA